MSKSFQIICNEQLAVDAVEIMEHHKIAALTVLNSKRELVAAVNIRLHLSAGVFLR